jgi:hypothetical protein
MSEAKKVAIGVVSGVLGIAVLFTLILMILGKGDEPVFRPQPIVAQQTKPVPPKPGPVQPEPVQAEQPLATDSVRPVPALNLTEYSPGRQGQQQSNQRLQDPENTPGTAEYIAKHIDEDLAKVHAENDSPATATATETDSKAGATTQTDRLGGASGDNASRGNPVSGNPVSVHHSCPKRRTDTGFQVRKDELKPDFTQYFGKEASEFTASLLNGQRVRLEIQTVPTSRDRYGRLLAFVYRESDNLLVNKGIIRQGYGHAYTNNGQKRG